MPLTRRGGRDGRARVMPVEAGVHALPSSVPQGVVDAGLRRHDGEPGLTRQVPTGGPR